MPRWIHSRAKHILAKNPDMEKGTAFAIATQQAHATGKTPKDYGTVEGESKAKDKYQNPGSMETKPNPGNLKTKKLAALNPSPMWGTIAGKANKPMWRSQAGFTPTGMKTPAQKLQKSMNFGSVKGNENLKPLNIKVGQLLVSLTKQAFNLNMYSGNLNPPKLRHESSIPPWSEPPVKTAGPPSEKLKGKIAAAPMQPMARLNKARTIGTPKATGPKGPSIAQIAKPKGYGEPLPGAVKLPKP
jgi:hypothetical protein